MRPVKSAVPKHVGVILDGNRRFSKRLMLKPWKGHEWGAKKVHELLGWCEESGVNEVTLYALSIENLNRPKEELKYLMDLFRKEFENLKNDESMEKKGIRVNVIGRLYLLPKDVQKKIQEVMEKTKQNKKCIVNVALAYGGRSEIIDAVRKIVQHVKEGKLDVSQINEEVFSRELYIPDEPDMIIRTGGERRTSNFLNFQAAYSEWFYVEKMWPEFEKEDFLKCVQEFSDRQRRFGK